jgi:hypothetical protein
MRTDDLIAQLSVDAPPSRLKRPGMTLAIASAVAFAVVLTVSATWLGLRADLRKALLFDDHALLLNLTFALSIGASALAIVRDLAVPGRRVGLPGLLTAAPFLLMAALVGNEVRTGALHLASSHIDHTSLFTCIWQIAALAVPAFAILFFGLRRLAPTDLSRSGLYVGLLAGAIGTFGFCLHAAGDSVLPVALAASIGIGLMAALGHVVGPRLLRWK